MRRIVGRAAAFLTLLVVAASSSAADVTRAQVERAIKAGVDYLKQQQGGGGVWPGQAGTTPLVTLALLTAGETTGSAEIADALDMMAKLTPQDFNNNTYAVSLVTMAMSAANPEKYQRQIAMGGAWLEAAQIIPGRVGGNTPGAWTYNPVRYGSGDNSNTQYAMLGLQAAREAGVPIRHDTWLQARNHWAASQNRDGGFGYHIRTPSTASMTCAGISSLVIADVSLVQESEQLAGAVVHNCGRRSVDPDLERAIDWMGANFSVTENSGAGQSWLHYYLYGLERAGRLTGRRYFGGHDWYREGAAELVRQQNPVSGAWNGQGGPVVTTSFALLFLAKGRSPVLINKLRHGPGADWDNDRDDIRNLVGSVSRDWGHLLTWQVADPASASTEELLQAPIGFITGHQAPTFGAAARQNLREYVEQGGTILAEACCRREEFDRGFRELMELVFPEPEYRLHELPEDHPVYRTRYRLGPDVHPLWGIEHGCRTVVIYSPGDLSCFWNHLETQPANVHVVKAQRVGQNIVDYVTGRELPADKLEVREVQKLGLERPRRGSLQIAKLRHAGDWNIAPLAIPNLTSALRSGPLKFDVVVNHREIAAQDPNLINYPLVYIHGRGAVEQSDDDCNALVRHLTPGGGTLFADAACGSPAFDKSFRALVGRMLPGRKLEPIPADDPIYGRKVGYDLSRVEFTRSADLPPGPPRLEGVKLDGHWAIIYSPLDIGCALESHQGHDCKGYVHADAVKIAANIVVYATLP